MFNYLTFLFFAAYAVHTGKMRTGLIAFSVCIIATNVRSPVFENPSYSLKVCPQDQTRDDLVKKNVSAIYVATAFASADSRVPARLLVYLYVMKNHVRGETCMASRIHESRLSAEMSAAS